MGFLDKVLSAFGSKNLLGSQGSKIKKKTGEAILTVRFLEDEKKEVVGYVYDFPGQKEKSSVGKQSSHYTRRQTATLQGVLTQSGFLWKGHIWGEGQFNFWVNSWYLGRKSLKQTFEEYLSDRADLRTNKKEKKIKKNDKV